MKPLTLAPEDLGGLPPALLAELSRGARRLAAELAGGRKLTRRGGDRIYVEQRLREIRSRSCL